MPKEIMSKKGVLPSGQEPSRGSVLVLGRSVAVGLFVAVAAAAGGRVWSAGGGGGGVGGEQVLLLLLEGRAWNYETCLEFLIVLRREIK